MAQKSEWSEIDAPFFSTYTHTPKCCCESDDRSGEERLHECCERVRVWSLLAGEWRVEWGQAGDKCVRSTDGENKRLKTRT
jgi:hypothetical protein